MISAIHGLALLSLLLSSGLLTAADQPPRQRIGNYDVTLRAPADGLYAKEEMEIELRLEDASRPDPQDGSAPVVRARVEAQIDMPEMPGMPAYREVAHSEGVPGEYGVHPTFAHGGEYRMRLTIAPPQTPAFHLEFRLLVSDNGSAGRKARPPRYSLELTTTPKRPKAGESVELRFLFRDREDPKAIFSNFEVMHEALFHLVMVRADLSSFEHQHPVLAPDGTFRLRHVFPSGGEYRLFADVAPKGAGAQNLMAKLAVSGTRTEAFRIEETPTESSRETGRTGVQLTLPASGLAVRKTNRILVGITDMGTHSAPADLEPYLGAAGHFMFVHEDSLTFVHSHPTEDAGALRDGRLEFLARFPKPGLYRGWIQVKRSGEVVTTDFVLRAGSAP